jgi:hypothetical protein
LINQRTRIVSFRLSEDEYQKLADSFPGQGARSVSDLVRVALVRLSGNGGGDPASDSLHSLSRQLRRLEREVKRMSEVLEQSGRPHSRAQASGRG